MANEYAITAAVDRVSLDANRRGQTTFTVSNRTANPMPSRARVVTQLPEAQTWFTVIDAERTIPASETQQFTVNIAVPPAATEGDYAFRLDVVGVENPDELFTQGPGATLAVPAPGAEPKKFPWWILAVAAGVLVLIIVSVVAVLLLGDDGGEEPQIVAQGRVLVSGGNFVDFDTGEVIIDGTPGDGDIQVIGAVIDNVALRTANEARAFVVVADAAGNADCAEVESFQTEIALQRIEVGNLLCVRTSDGNLAEASIRDVQTVASLPVIVRFIQFTFTTRSGG